MSSLSPDLVDMWLFSYYIYPYPFYPNSGLCLMYHTCHYLWLMFCLMFLSLASCIYPCLMALPHGPYLNMRTPWGYSLLQYKYPVVVLYKGQSCSNCTHFIHCIASSKVTVLIPMILATPLLILKCRSL